MVLHHDGGSATWDDLLTASGRLAGVWAPLVPAGAVVAIIAANGLVHLLAELAAWRLGAIAAPVPATAGPQRLTALLDRLRPALLVCTGAAPGGRPHWNAAAVQAAAGGHGPAGPERPVTAATAALVLATSGSSGEPRLATLSHGNIASQQRAFAALWPEIGPGDRLASYLPWHHSFGALAERLWALGRGAAVTVVPGDGRDAAALTRTVRAVTPTVWMSVPKHHRTVTAGGALDATALRWVFTAGAALGGQEEAWYRARGVTVHEGWGLTETSPSATITGADRPRLPGVVGEPIPGVAVGVRDGDGRLFVRGPGVMLGYRQADGSCAAPPIDDSGLAVIDTGDVGAWTPDGLVLHGRADLTVKLANGEKADLAAIAGALEERPGVRHAVVTVHGGRLIALLAGTGDLAAVIAAHNRDEPLPWLRLAGGWQAHGEPNVEDGWLTPSLKVARGRWLREFAAGQGFRPLAAP